MKKVQITSKDGKKTEVYYLSDHPLNKFTIPEGAEVQEGKMETHHENDLTPTEQAIASMNKFSAFYTPHMEGFSGANPEEGYESACGKVFEKLPTKLQHSKWAELIFGKKSPSTIALDDSIKKDKVASEDLVFGNLYKIKGLNVVAKLINPWPQQPKGIYRFSFHGHEFFVDLNMILKP